MSGSVGEDGRIGLGLRGRSMGGCDKIFLRLGFGAGGKMAGLLVVRIGGGSPLDPRPLTVNVVGVIVPLK